MHSMATMAAASSRRWAWQAAMEGAALSFWSAEACALLASQKHATHAQLKLESCMKYSSKSELQRRLGHALKYLGEICKLQNLR